MARRRLAAALAGAALVAAACSGGGSPQGRLESAATATFDSSFAYELTVEVDGEALEALGPGGGQAVGILQSLRVAGRHTEGANEIVFGVLGFDVLELRALGEEAVFLKLALGELAGIAGASVEDLSASVIPSLREAGLGDEVVSAVEAALDGRWVGVEGEVDPQALQDALGLPDAGGATAAPDEEEVEEALGGDLAGFVERFVEVVEVREEGGSEVFAVNLALRDLIRTAAEVSPGAPVEDLEADLGSVPEQVPATVTVVDDRITRFAVDVAESVEQLPGAFEIRLDLSEHGAVEEVTAPDDAVTITSEQLVEALSSLSGLGGIVPTG